MNSAATVLLPLAVVLFSGGCKHRPPVPAPPAAETLAPSPRLIVGRIIAIDPALAFAFVELAPDAPRSVVGDGAELIVRTLELTETARLHASRFVRGRTLGAKIISGKPSPGEEVVWLAP